MSDSNEFYVGIDFGTCNIKAAVYNDQKNKIEVHKFNKNQLSDITPNIVEIKKDSISIGNIKFRKKQEQTIVTNIKRHLEEENWNIYIPSRSIEMSAVDIAYEEFRWIKDNIEAKYKKSITEAVITVPVCFSELQKQRIKRAALSAGFKIKEVVTEPFAGFFSYDILNESVQDSKILIFDFGGGTLDLSVFKISESNSNLEIECLASKGIHYGGNDITELLYNELIEKKYSDKVQSEIEERMKHNFLNDDNYSDEEKQPDSDMYKKHYSIHSGMCHDYFMKEINSLKEEICESEDTSTCMFTECLNEYFDTLEIEYSYSELIKLLDMSGISFRIADALNSLVDTAMIDYSDISKVLMIGGSSKICYFRNLIKEELGIDDENEIFVDLDSNSKYNAVAVGAAAYLIKKDMLFKIVNRVSYEVGTIENNEKYMRRMDLNSAYNDVPTLRKPVVLEEYNESSYKKNIYQLFFDSTIKKVDPDKDPIYMGFFQFEKTKYDKNGKYLMELYFDLQGIIHANIFDSSGVFIETKAIVTEE